MSESDQGQSRRDLVSAHIGRRYDQRDLLGLSLEGQILAHSRFIELDLRRMDFRGANLIGATFIRCDLREAIFHYAQLESVQFIDCQLDGGDFWSTEISNLFVGSQREHSMGDREVDDQSYQVRYMIVQGYLYEIYHWAFRPSDQDTASSSRPLILLHGMTGHALDFKQLAAHAKRPVYAIQLLGHGVTSYIPLAEEAELVEDGDQPERIAPSYEEVVDQVIELIAELLSDDGYVSQPSVPQSVSFDLLGYSMGGRLALHIARAFDQASKHPLAQHIQVHQTLVIGASLGLKEEHEREARRQQDRLGNNLFIRRRNTIWLISLFNKFSFFSEWEVTGYAMSKKLNRIH